MTQEEKKQRHRDVARESARIKNGYYQRKHVNKKECHRPVVDLSDFESWYEVNFVKGQNVKVPKLITFKEHIRVLSDRDRQYELLLASYNELVDKYNELLDKEA